MIYELTVIVPTLNESGNVSLLYSKIANTLKGSNFAVLFVDDDSQDGTINEINTLIAKHNNVQLIRRINRRGISSAFIEGVFSSSSKYIAIIDADLQHEESLLSEMLYKLKTQKLDIIIASRFKDLSDRKVVGLSGAREQMSRFGNALCGLVSGAHLTDPLTGFFMIRKPLMDKIIYKLSGVGFKIMLDIFATCKNEKIKLRFQEIHMNFRKRNKGKSKLDIVILYEFALLIFDKLFGKFIPIRFVLFLIVGLTGLCIHTAILSALMNFSNASFYISQLISTIIAMTSNFFVNNSFTYRDKRLKGTSQLVKGLLSFYLACSFGAFINVTTANFLYDKKIYWLLSGVIGSIIGATWNYGISSYFTWGKTKKQTLA